MKKLLFVLLVLLLAACSTQGDKIKIGVPIPHSSYAATFAEYVEQGVTLAMERLPEEERNKIELVFEDDKAEAIASKNVAEKFVHLDNIKFIVGHFHTTSVIPTTDFYDDAEVVRLVTGLGTDTYVGIGNYQYVLLGDVQSLMEKLAEHAYQDGKRRIVILYQHDDYGQENADYFQETFEALGGEIVLKEAIQRFGNRDYRTSILKAKELQPDAVLLGAAGNIFLTALRQTREWGLDVDVYGIRNTEDTEILKNAGQLLEGVTFPSITVPSTTEEGIWYEQTYKERFGAQHEVVSANAYDSFMILWEAIKICDEDVDCVKNEIESIDIYEGVSGSFSIDERRFGVRDVVIKQVINRSFEII